MNERQTKIALEQLDKGEEIIFRVRSRRWMRTQTTELLISKSCLEARGDLGGYQRGTLRLSWGRVTELHYGPAGRGAIEGLYAREGQWCSRCVLPWISEAQADEVIAAIATRFPCITIHPESALEAAVGEAMAQESLVQRSWLPPLGRRGVAVAAPSGRV